jgi:hypothetical protein
VTGNERGDQDHDQGDAWPEIRAEQAERDRAYHETRAALVADVIDPDGPREDQR